VDDRAAQEHQPQQRRQRQRTTAPSERSSVRRIGPPFGGGGLRGQPWKRRLADRLA